MKKLYSIVCALLLLFFTQKLLAQVPTINSYPVASAVLFLDFDGHTVEGTSWNGNGPIVCNGANLSADQITEIVSRVAEDYRPFNINITTDSTKYWAAPARQRTRVVLTTSSSWFGSAGGVAFTNSFTWGDNTPCFVFTALLKYNAKFIAEAASHEAGHTLGLNHQSSYDAICNKTTEYNPGTGSGEIGWAPIMGVGYYRNQTLWHYGSNPFGCNYMQDDLSILTSAANGISFRTDDYGNTTASASAVSFTNNQFSVNGVIEKPADRDIIKFDVTQKAKFQLSALPFSVANGDNGANIDLQIGLSSSIDTNTFVYNPPTELKVAIDTVLNPGTYYLKVEGTGNVFAPDFASLGSYSLTGSILATALPVHKLELKATADNNRHNLAWDIVADEKVISQTIEVATDNVDFQSLLNVAADARTYAYSPAKAALVYYRLNVTFDNGRQYYSNVVALRSDDGNSPILVSNVVTTNLSINSVAKSVYVVHDLNGRRVAKGQLTQGLNTVSVNSLSGGIYILQVENNGEHYTEKFIKR